MKKMILIILSITTVSILLSSCTSEKGLTKEMPFDEINLATYTLENAKKDGYVIMEDGDVTSGQEKWESFFTETQDGVKSTIRLVKNYTLGDPSGYSEALYNSIKDDYPILYLFELVFDGDNYTITYYEDEQKYANTYPYLIKCTGKERSPSALFSDYTRYILTEDETVTWEAIFASMITSNSTKALSFATEVVYSDLVYKEE